MLKSGSNKDLQIYPIQLLSMYQERLKIKGFAHLKEDKMHEEFASFFPYVETKDQQKQSMKQLLIWN